MIRFIVLVLISFVTSVGLAIDFSKKNTIPDSFLKTKSVDVADFAMSPSSPVAGESVTVFISPQGFSSSDEVSLVLEAELNDQPVSLLNPGSGLWILQTGSLMIAGPQNLNVDIFIEDKDQASATRATITRLNQEIAEIESLLAQEEDDVERAILDQQFNDKQDEITALEQYLENLKTFMARASFGFQVENGPAESGFPVIDSISPNVVSAIGGATVIVLGENFTSDATLNVGGIEINDVFIDTNTLQFSMPNFEAEPGLKDLSVTVTSDNIAKSAFVEGALYASDSLINSPPVALAGTNQTVIGDSAITVDGSGSYDPDSDILAYDWSFVSIPASSLLSDADLTDDISTTFFPDVPGNYILSLTVSETSTDDFLVSGLSQVVISVLPFPVENISAGGQHSCAIVNAMVWCWGDNQYGQLGDGTNNDSSVPVEVVGLADVPVQVSSGASHTCAVLSDGRLQCWGRNNQGQLGNGATSNSQTPVFVGDGANDISDAIQVAAGDLHTCLLLADSRAMCWGEGANGRLGTGSSNNESNAVFVCESNGSGGCTGAHQTGLTKLTAGDNYTCALTEQDTAMCWGDNGDGRLGINSTTDSPVPVFVCSSADCSLLLQNVIDISADRHTCAAVTSGEVYCWGADSAGQIGNGAGAGASLLPMNVCADPSCATNLSGMDKVAVGSNFSCASNTTGIQCWGGNGPGSLGNGQNGNQQTPVRVFGISTDVEELSLGQEHSCAIIGDRAKCWGKAIQGQLGNGATGQNSNSSVPVDVFGFYDF